VGQNVALYFLGTDLFTFTVDRVFDSSLDYYIVTPLQANKTTGLIKSIRAKGLGIVLRCAVLTPNRITGRGTITPRPHPVELLLLLIALLIDMKIT